LTPPGIGVGVLPGWIGLGDAPALGAHEATSASAAIKAAPCRAPCRTAPLPTLLEPERTAPIQPGSGAHAEGAAMTREAALAFANL
jgi:hypothetical protein